MQSYADLGESQARNYWSRMTVFKNGAFELSVNRPHVEPVADDIIRVHVSKDTKFNFCAAAASSEPGKVKVIPARARQALTPEEREAKDAANLARSVRRARSRVRHLAKALEADHMLTFSYRENMQDVRRLKSDWAKFLRSMRGRYPNFQFICVREQQERGAYHLHVAVKGKQDIKWILRCWLLAIGQDWDDVQAWYVHGKALGDRSMGAVNVRAPQTRWGAKQTKWRSEKLAGYMTKYLGKEFAKAEHHSLRYWHSKGIEKPLVIKFWLGATNFSEAVSEAYDTVFYKGAENLSMWQPDNWENLFICGDGLKLELLQEQVF